MWHWDLIGCAGVTTAEWRRKTRGRMLWTSYPPLQLLLWGGKKTASCLHVWEVNQVSCWETSATRCTLAHATHREPTLSLLTPLKPSKHSILRSGSQCIDFTTYYVNIHVMLVLWLLCRLMDIFSGLSLPSSFHLDQFILISSPSSVHPHQLLQRVKAAAGQQTIKVMTADHSADPQTHIPCVCVCVRACPSYKLVYLC